MLCPHAALDKALLACVYNASFAGEGGQAGASSESFPLCLFDLQNNQVLGIGSGSTIVHAVQRLGRTFPFLSFPPQKNPLFHLLQLLEKHPKSPACRLRADALGLFTGCCVLLEAEG